MSLMCHDVLKWIFCLFCIPMVNGCNKIWSYQKINQQKNQPKGNFVT